MILPEARFEQCLGYSVDREIGDTLEAAHERSIAHRAKTSPPRKPEHQRDIEQRLLAWFDRYLMR